MAVGSTDCVKEIVEASPLEGGRQRTLRPKAGAGVKTPIAPNYSRELLRFQRAVRHLQRLPEGNRAKVGRLQRSDSGMKVTIKRRLGSLFIGWSSYEYHARSRTLEVEHYHLTAEAIYDQGALGNPVHSSKRFILDMNHRSVKAYQSGRN